MARAANQPIADDEPQADGRPRATTSDARADRAKKARLTSQLEEATNRYQEASAAGDLGAKRTALADMRTSRKQISALSDDVKHKHAGMLPAWWNE